MIKDEDKNSSLNDQKYEEFDKKAAINKSSNNAMLENEKDDEEDDINVIDDFIPDTTSKDNVAEQYNQSYQLTTHHIKYKNYKQRNMEEFTNDYSISQVVPSGWTTFFNILSTIFFTIVVVIGIFAGVCLILNVRTGVVPTTSMEPTISAGSLMLYRPLGSEDEIKAFSEYNGVKVNDGTILCYELNGITFVHRVSEIINEPGEETKYKMIGDNEELNEELQNHIITKSNIKGVYVLSIPYIGILIYFIRSHIILAVVIFVTITLAILLARNIIENNHAKA
jgi:signal peptidase I